MHVGPVVAVTELARAATSTKESSGSGAARLRSAGWSRRTAGVPFLGSDDLPSALDQDGVSSDTTGLEVAWWKDPDGNILTVFQPAQSS